MVIEIEHVAILALSCVAFLGWRQAVNAGENAGTSEGVTKIDGRLSVLSARDRACSGFRKMRSSYLETGEV
jgi:hypothetical protein